MMDGMGEAAIQQSIRSDHVNSTYDKDLSAQKIEKNAQERAVEASAAKAQTENKTEEKELESRYVIDKAQIAYEKYNERGDVVFRVPPTKIPPIDEVV